MAKKKQEPAPLSPLEQELSLIACEFLDLPGHQQYKPKEIVESANLWFDSVVKHVQRNCMVADVDIFALMTMRDIYEDSLLRKYYISIEGPMVENSKGDRKEHPLYPGLRACWLALKQFYTAQGMTLMSRQNKHMNLEKKGGAASHGNQKDNPVFEHL